MHLHLVSDSTGETLEMIAKAALAQFEDAQVTRHFWPMVRSRQHLDRIVPDLADNPGLVMFTLVNAETRARWKRSSGKRRMAAPAASI
jgi:regulator of PEP synthase PpsR (kinase-PPPase family)